MSNNSELVDQLKGKPLFSGFSEEELAGFVDLLEVVSFPEGETIVKQDDHGDCMYIVVNGEARVVHHRARLDIELAVLKDGDFFGEIALVDDGPRSADVQALTDCTLLKVTREVVGALAGTYASKFFMAVGRILVARFRLTNERYIDTRQRYLDTKQHYIDSMLYPVYGQH